MKFQPKRHRVSVFSRENTDQFFSAPSSRTGTPIPHPLESRMPSRSDYSRDPDPMTSAPAPSQENAPAQGWTLALPFAVSHRWPEIGYRYLSPKPLLSLLRRGLTGSEPDPRDSVHGAAMHEPDNPVNTPNTALLISPAKSPSPDVSQQGPTKPAMESINPPGVPPLSGLDHIVVTPRANRASTHDIVRNVRAYLSDKRHVHCTGSQPGPVSLKENRPLKTSSSLTNQPPSSDRAASTYLITTTDIMGILDIVMTGLQEGQDRQSSPMISLLKLLPRSRTSGSRTIFPRALSGADPATTISSAQPTFSPYGGAKGSSRHGESRREPLRAIFISRRSIIEVD